MITAYLVGVAVTLALFAVRTPDTEVRTVALIALAWPVMLPFCVLLIVLDQFCYDIDIQGGAKMLGFRRSPNPKAQGVAVSFCTVEVQIWKKRKA